MLTGMSDRRHWRGEENIDPAWEERSRIIASLVPKASRVIEFGAGRGVLANFLDPTCSYVASDFVRRGPETRVWDLNERPLPDLSSLAPDVAVFAGVFEYIARLNAIPFWLSRYVSMCIASYECARTARGAAGRIRERWDRARIGWVNTYTESELTGMFARSGFLCTDRVLWHTPEGTEPIFVFARLKVVG
jgi:hypothetical protein